MERDKNRALSNLGISPLANYYSELGKEDIRFWEIVLTYSKTHFWVSIAIFGVALSWGKPGVIAGMSISFISNLFTLKRARGTYRDLSVKSVLND